MTDEQLRMQMLSGVITEGEYKTKLEENAEKELTYNDFVRMVRNDMMAGASPDEYPSDEQIKNKAKAYYNEYLQGTSVDDLFETKSKESLNEHYVAGGIVGIGAITQIPSREKTDYEMAFEHFLGERYQLKPNRERDDIKDINEEEDVEEGKEVKVNEYDDFNTESSSVFFSQLANKLKNFLKNEIDLSGIEIDGVEIPEEEHLNDAVEGMMEVLGVVMKGKAYTVGEKEVSPEFLNRFK